MSTLSITATDPVVPADDEVARPQQKSKKRKMRRRIAKGLAYLSLAITALLVLSEPWLLLPLITFVVALSLWD
ncbi:hypothetical protein AMIS_79330 [Actinoplanes missouriensis 431]|uniref:Uncharacterized protein n=1 Tax=Actinoplanes missouriensis (strain ATCC 14538 / DSM 43046 / CBS 188.64 / JCM 3121 / NBRC 102363 / NCIMB 12654 / NRRL B-3342 / UNCC 431) TaxID=512565 RepID=I0HJG6_ACTM4|nr:hypothetical protein [Actinoplanes missouriensis]BAL93153.1 hypothetical protein AMIS_79330 [Actinoplanes missouriensis 431]